MQNKNIVNKDIEEILEKSVAHVTPDVWENILSECKSNQGNVFMSQPRKSKNNWFRAAGAVAAAFVLVFTGMFAYGRIENGKSAALIMLDVNPSIELQINKNDRVIQVLAKNEDAIKILDNMDLKDTQINVAVNALIGSMLKYGYVRENANSVLLSVEGDSKERVMVLQKNLSASISGQLNLVNGAVISQQLDADGETQRLADEHQISYGKAALVRKIIAENSHLYFADLAQLSVNELNLLISSKRIEADGMEAQGSASDTDFIGDQAAALAALEHAGVSESDTQRIKVELDYDDGRMIYEIEFIYNSDEYEYEIDAKDGSVIEFNHEQTRIHGEENQTSVSQSQAVFIGEDRVAEIIKDHSETTDQTGMKIKMEKDDGLYIYEVEFQSGGSEYDYEINASTGEIISWEMEED